MLKKINLESCFKHAIEKGYNYLGVVVKVDENHRELIVNTKNNFQSKLKYYKLAYDENLNHNIANEMSITDFTYGNTLADIENKLKKNFI